MSRQSVIFFFIRSVFGVIIHSVPVASSSVHFREACFEGPDQGKVSFVYCNVSLMIYMRITELLTVTVVYYKGNQIFSTYFYSSEAELLFGFFIKYV